MIEYNYINAYTFKNDGIARIGLYARELGVAFPGMVQEY